MHDDEQVLCARTIGVEHERVPQCIARETEVAAAEAHNADLLPRGRELRIERHRMLEQLERGPEPVAGGDRGCEPGEDRRVVRQPQQGGAERALGSRVVMPRERDAAELVRGTRVLRLQVATARERMHRGVEIAGLAADVAEVRPGDAVVRPQLDRLLEQATGQFEVAVLCGEHPEVVRGEAVRHGRFPCSPKLVDDERVCGHTRLSRMSRPVPRTLIEG